MSIVTCAHNMCIGLRQKYLHTSSICTTIQKYSDEHKHTWDVYIYIPICIRIYISLRTYMYKSMDTCSHTYIHTDIVIHTYTYTIIHTYIDACIDAYTHTCIHTLYLHTYIHTILHTHSNAYMDVCKFRKHDFSIPAVNYMYVHR